MTDQPKPETGNPPHARARDPRVESIYGGVRERNDLPVSDPYRFMVNILPHQCERGPGNQQCAWCPYPRVHPVHPEEEAW